MGNIKKKERKMSHGSLVFGSFLFSWFGVVVVEWLVVVRE